ncbi:MAG: hypothetical protein ACREFP_03900 [Acetobacteraceae bacterium]
MTGRKGRQKKRLQLHENEALIDFLCCDARAPREFSIEVLRLLETLSPEKREEWLRAGEALPEAAKAPEPGEGEL